MSSAGVTSKAGFQAPAVGGATRRPPNAADLRRVALLDHDRGAIGRGGVEVLRGPATWNGMPWWRASTASA